MNFPSTPINVRLFSSHIYCLTFKEMLRKLLTHTVGTFIGWNQIGTTKLILSFFLFTYKYRFHCLQYIVFLCAICSLYWQLPLSRLIEPFIVSINANDIHTSNTFYFVFIFYSFQQRNLFHQIMVCDLFIFCSGQYYTTCLWYRDVTRKVFENAFNVIYKKTAEHH